MSLRAALLAIHANPQLDTETLPDDLLSLDVLAGIVQAIQEGLVDVQEDGSYLLSPAAVRMVTQPVRLAS